MSFQLANISKSFDEVKALQGINLDASEGEILGLIGPDGAGKSTLMRILVTLMLPDEGKGAVCGLDIQKEYKEIRKIIGYMAGRFSLYHDLSVKENLQFYATVFGTTIREHYDLVKDVYAQIEPYENRLAGKLSGGMKQKLALSCALIHRPKMLVLDEPTTGVDAVSRKEFWDMLKRIRREGITILVSTPYMDEAAQCDRVGLLQKGKLMSLSDPAALSLRNGSRLYVFRCSGSIYTYLEKIRQADPNIHAWLFGDEIHVFMDDKVDTAGVTGAVQSWKVSGLEWKEIPPGVEDYFMQLMTEEVENENLSSG